MKILITIGIILAVFVVLVTGITLFLGPSDLRRCGEAPSNSSNCAAADAIVAVSGGDTNARVDAAVTDYRNGWAPLLIFSGAAQDPSAPSNAQAMKDRAISRGVPADDVLTEDFARNTSENAANTSKFINDRNLTRIILVTSAYHQRRANLEFGARLGPSVQIINAPVSEDKQWSSHWWITPAGWWLAIGEIVKIIAYYVSGGAA